MTVGAADHAVRRWTQTDINALRQGTVAGETATTLATRLHRNVDDLLRMAHRLNLTVRVAADG